MVVLPWVPAATSDVWSIGDLQPGKFNGFRIVPGDDIADDDQIRPGCEVVRGVTFENIDSHGDQKVAHGRIDILIGTGDLKAAGFQHAGQGAHAGAADPHQVDMAHPGRTSIEGCLQFQVFPAGVSGTDGIPYRLVDILKGFADIGGRKAADLDKFDHDLLGDFQNGFVGNRFYRRV